MPNVTLDQEQYLAIVSLARQGAQTPDKKRVLERFLQDIDEKNGVTRYVLWVQWQEQEQPLPPTTNFPETWPPQMRAILERVDRPIAKSDVLKVVKDRARNPTNILVTRDVGALVGWTAVNDYFIT